LATIYDVAAVAGVSPKTVSRVLNDHPNVRPQTREKVHSAIAELGYQINAMAKGLRTSQSNVLGFITDDIATAPFAVDIVKGAQETAFEHEKTLLVRLKRGRPPRQWLHAHSLCNSPIIVKNLY
jgi:LacI family transcriptional regulator